MVNSERGSIGDYNNPLHAISFLRERLDDQFLIITSPSFVTSDESDLSADVFSDIFLVSGFVMKGNTERGERLKTVADVNFWPACDTYSQIGELEFHNLLNKIE